MSWSRFQKLGAVALGGVGGASLYWYMDRRVKPNAVVLNSWTTNFEPSPCAKWDSNWDHRDPKSLVKPIKNKGDPVEENKHNEKLELAKPKAVRHLFLIRHGQYNIDGETDAKRYLTEVGRKQADFTGNRLKALNLPWTKMYRSTMTRAQETGKIISESLPGVPIENTELLEEGAPIPPEPPIGHWRPEKSASSFQVHKTPPFDHRLFLLQQFFQDGARIEAAFRKVFHRADASQEKDSYELVVCHANVIRYFVCRALQFPPEGWLRLSLNHASITWVSILPSGRVVVRNVGDSGHIPPDFVTSR